MAKDDPARARRLAEALRANLHRRKAQTRDRTEADDRLPMASAGDTAAGD